MKIRQALIEQAPSLELQRAAAAEIARLDAALADAERRLAEAARAAQQCADHGSILRVLEPNAIVSGLPPEKG